MKKDISKEISVLNDALSALTNANGMQDCDANWDKLTAYLESKYEQEHLGQPTADFASSVYAAVLKHIENLTVPECGEEGDSNGQ